MLAALLLAAPTYAAAAPAAKPHVIFLLVDVSHRTPASSQRAR